MRRHFKKIGLLYLCSLSERQKIDAMRCNALHTFSNRVTFNPLCRVEICMFTIEWMKVGRKSASRLTLDNSIIQGIFI